MANPNAPDQPDIGTETQFKANDPRQAQNIKGANKPWSIRKALSNYAHHEIDVTDPKAIEKLTNGKMTMAQAIALKAMTKAIKGDMRAIEYATENIDGKLPETHRFGGDPDNDKPITTVSLPPSS